jgi:hypothetical protein
MVEIAVPADKSEAESSVVSAPQSEIKRLTRSVLAHGGMRDAFLYAFIGALVLGAWGFTRLHLYDNKSDTAYWLGVGGGVGMLLLLTYPMRKHLRFMQRFGAGSRWFAAHMILGVAGPVLILLHSNFQIGSLNAGVAFYSMVTVALSGVIGRFLYVRLHSNLRGEKLSLGQLRSMMGTENAVARLRFAPLVVERCREFERWAIERRSITLAEVMRAMVLVPVLRWRAEWDCRAELRRRLVAVAHTEGWSRRKLNSRLRAARKLTSSYLGGAQRVAMFSAWEQLFSWWHVAHVPFVYILALSAVVHVIAVHAY